MKFKFVSLVAAVSVAIGLVVAAGVPVVLSTGRSWHATLPIFEALGLPWRWDVVRYGELLRSPAGASGCCEACRMSRGCRAIRPNARPWRRACTR